jgi:hypothetical protein
LFMVTWYWFTNSSWLPQEMNCFCCWKSRSF